MLATDERRTLIRAVDARQDAHQRGFAGAVLAQQGVDLTDADVKIDVVVGDDAWKPLDDPSHLYREGLFVHGWR
jgi:hypothetical protein